MDKLRVGVIGLGWPGQQHLEAYLGREDVDVAGVSDLNAELAERVRTRLGIRAPLYADYREMLAADVDAVSICTPNFLHAPMAIDALDAGKHVLLEKPLANTLAEGERIAEKVRSSDRKFMMAFNNRYRRDSRVLKRQIEAGVLGDIYYAKTGWLRREWNPIVRGWFTSREKSGGGPLIDLGVHMLDLTLWFMGNPRPVSVSGSVYSKFGEYMRPKIGYVDVEDLAAAFIKLDNGGTIVMDVSWLSFIEHPDYVYSQLFGSKGGAKIERYSSANDLRIYTNQDGIPLVQQPTFDAYEMQGQPLFMTHDSFKNEIAHFVESVRDGTPPEATITHGLDILRILDAIYRSAETGREVHLSADPEAEHLSRAG